MKSVNNLHVFNLLVFGWLKHSLLSVSVMCKVSLKAKPEIHTLTLVLLQQTAFSDRNLAFKQFFN